MSLPKLSRRPALRAVGQDPILTKDPARFIEALEKGLKRNVIHRVERKEFNDDDKTATFVVNSHMDDRDQEIVLPSAVIESRDIYMLNPVFLWGHRHRGNPEDILGTCLDAQLVDSDTKIMATFQYDVEIFERTAKVFEQVKKGTVRAVSIGFIPQEWVTAWDSEEKINRLPAYAAEGLKSGRVWVVYTKVEWVETSQVPIGSNRQALAASLGERSDEESLIERLLELLDAKTAGEPEEKVPGVIYPVKDSGPDQKEIELDAQPAEKAAELPGQDPHEASDEPEAKDAGEPAAADAKADSETEKELSLHERLASVEADLKAIYPLVKQLLSEQIKAAFS